MIRFTPLASALIWMGVLAALTAAQSESGIAGKITLAASSTTKETAPYTAITRKTRRRFISSSHRW